MIDFVEKIKKNVLINPDKVAYKVNEKVLTYSELLEKALLYANCLNKQGSEPVVIYGHKSINMVVSIISCLLAKRCYIPVDTNVPKERLDSIIKLSKASLLIKNEEISIDSIPNCNLEELVQFNVLETQKNKNNICYIIFTSGSTGIPKGVPITYDNLDNFVKWIGSIEPLNNYHNLNILNQASFSFDLSVADFYYSMCYNHTLVGLNSNYEDLNGIFNTIKINKINLMVITPTFMKICLVNNDFNADNYNFLKCLYFCGELLEVDLVKKIYERFPDIKIINAYGPTEATSAVSSILITRDMLNDELLPVGDINSAATKIDIIKNKIFLSGKSVFQGYLGDKSNVDLYDTGDIGFIKYNKLYCKGRCDSQIKYKGFRIELFDIENNIKKIKGIKDCAVIAKYNENNIVKLIKAFIILDKDLEIEMIKTILKDKLPEYMIPKLFIKL